VPNPTVAITSSDPSVLGTMCRQITRIRGKPRLVADSTYPDRRTTSASARTSRSYSGTNAIATATATFVPDPSTAITSSASKSDGSASSTSAPRIRIWSVPAAERGQQADQSAAGDSQHCGHDAQQQRRARPVEHSGEHVPAQLVGAEPVRAARRHQRLGHIRPGG
jgi:hypothetical protein